MTDGSITDGRRSNALLWIVAAAFAGLLAAWITFLVMAGRHPVVPVTAITKGSGTR